MNVFSHRPRRSCSPLQGAILERVNLLTRPHPEGPLQGQGNGVAGRTSAEGPSCEACHGDTGAALQGQQTPAGKPVRVSQAAGPKDAAGTFGFHGNSTLLLTETFGQPFKGLKRPTYSTSTIN